MCLNFEGEKEGRSYKFQYQYTDFILKQSVSLLDMVNILSNLTYFYYFLLARELSHLIQEGTRLIKSREHYEPPESVCVGGGGHLPRNQKKQNRKFTIFAKSSKF